MKKQFILKAVEQMNLDEMAECLERDAKTVAEQIDDLKSLAETLDALKGQVAALRRAA